MKNFYPLIIVCLLSTIGYGQHRIIFKPAISTNGVSLDTKFKRHQFVKVDLQEAYRSVQQYDTLRLELPHEIGGLYYFTENQLLAKDYKEVVAGLNGTRTSIARVKTFTGHSADGKSSMALTIGDGFLMAGITKSGKNWVVEQAQNVNGETDHQLMLVYAQDDVIEDGEYSCAVDDIKKKAKEVGSPDGERKLADGCKTIKLAIASDSSMVAKYGDAATVANRNISIVQSLRVLFRHEFVDNLEISIVAQYLSELNSTDPLLPTSTSTDPNVVLPRFANWGQTTGFGTAFDMAALWTNRDFDGTTVGYAYVGTLCRGMYQILQDYTSNMVGLQVLAAHEMGHNLGSMHDTAGSPYIMAPTVNYTTEWSAASKMSISAEINTAGACLVGCTLPVSADYIVNPVAGCPGGSITFKDKSSNSSSRNWTFEAGSPTTSTLAQPAVSYATAGTYDVNLLVDGVVNLSKPNSIIIGDPAINTASCPTPTGAPGKGGIRYFGLNTISHSSGNAVADNARYMDFSCSKITYLEPGTTYDVGMTVGNYSAVEADIVYEHVRVFIDYNGDGVFSGSELVVSSGGAAFAGGPVSYATSSSYSYMRFTTTATPTFNTLLRMRVISTIFGSPTSDPCVNPVDGQVEDYAVMFADQTALPVDLIAFNGSYENNRNRLKWQTNNESQMLGYHVERSLDGVAFKAVTFVPSQNYGTTAGYYDFTDDVVSQKVGGYYYRLKMEEMDGTSRFSRMIYLKNLDAQPTFALTHCQTLLNGPEMTYGLVSDKEREVQFSITNILGIRIKTWSAYIHDGSNQLKQDVSDMPNGIYFFTVESPGEPIIVEKILK
ncbi:PKD repeat protein [Dyadobacter jejuensis]|uniref:PKD repeat protein n=1 Tax=Dyadobacter jejuensis TaxID=1082580 RepID=A0A316ALI0_9BACT|nr:M12 family metallo-peptidase [Dyadobacter jejuensis]PWJ58436.1 PKD repeat protein [Dyadobacter jejuensis]